MPQRIADPVKSAFLFLALVFLASCSSSEPDLGLGLDFTREAGYPVAHLKYRDRDPQDFGSRPPGRYPVHGIDVSKWQGHIDWQAVKASGVEFAFIKATEGGDLLDSRFKRYTSDARAAGIPTGPYHFYFFCRSAAEQARWFIRNVPKSAAVLPPVLDMEWNHTSPSCKKRPSPAKVRKEMAIWLNMVERHFGRKPIIYTTIDFHRENIEGHFRDYTFWLRSVAAHPDDLYGDHPWHFWQYTGTGVIPGIEGNTDINVFAGDRSDWKKWLKDVRVAAR